MINLTLLLIVLTATHFLVDTIATVIRPLWPSLGHQLSLSEGRIQIAFVCWQLSTSLSQLVFGYLGDRYGRRWMIWAGPALAAACVGFVGWIDSLAVLCVVLALGGMGIAAFHPEAAALAGDCLPEHRSRAVSIFATGGFLGQTAGPFSSGQITTLFGLGALAWLVPGGLVALAVAALFLHREGSDHEHMQRASVPLGQLLAGKLPAVGLVLAIGTLRVLATLGTPLALAYVLAARGSLNAEIGLAQSIFQGGMGLGVLLCAVAVPRRAEWRLLWLLPLCVAPMQAFCVVAPPAALLVTVAGCGLLLGVIQPILIGYGQRLLPEGQRIASSLTMGVTWGIGGAAVAGTMAVVTSWGRPEAAFYLFAAALVVSTGLCAWLPRVDEATT